MRRPKLRVWSTSYNIMHNCRFQNYKTLWNTGIIQNFLSSALSFSEKFVLKRIFIPIKLRKNWPTFVKQTTLSETLSEQAPIWTLNHKWVSREGGVRDIQGHTSMGLRRRLVQAPRDVVWNDLCSTGNNENTDMNDQWFL